VLIWFVWHDTAAAMSVFVCQTGPSAKKKSAAVQPKPSHSKTDESNSSDDSSNRHKAKTMAVNRKSIEKVLVFIVLVI